mgnify:CR=1 FL=1
MAVNTFRRADNIGVRRVGDEIFILAPDGDLVVLGNETAVFLWEAVEDGATTSEELASRLCETYEVSPAQGRQDALDFERTLSERSVLVAVAK